MYIRHEKRAFKFAVRFSFRYTRFCSTTLLRGLTMKRLFLALLALSLPLLHVQQLLALSAAVAVPCYYKHFGYLRGLLESLAEQTHLPDQVVISLSQVERLAEGEVDALERAPWPFAVEIIRREGVYMEGANRTAAARRCSADIVLCIDADDIPHPQRTEAVLQLFESLPSAEFALCGHAYCPGESIICDRAIPFYMPEEFKAVRFLLGSDNWRRFEGEGDLIRWETGVHNGSPSLRRSLLEGDLCWSDLKNGADLEFNTALLCQQHEGYLIQLPLLHYYNGRSSGAEIGR